MGLRSGAGRSSSGRFNCSVSGKALVFLAAVMLLSDIRWVLAAVTAAAVHELGHLLALWMLDRRVLGMKIELGGAVIRTEPLSSRDELLCALAGPAAGLLLTLFFRWLPRTACCALAQSLFNLLPLYPLDGGRAFRNFRNICCKDDPKGVQ